jgi:hypothetical protein
MRVFRPPYHDIDSAIHDIAHDRPVLLLDHLHGFDSDRRNCILDTIDTRLDGSKRKVYHVQILDDRVRQRYQNLDFGFNFQLQHQLLWKPFEHYNTHPAPDHTNFVCSFNGAAHVSRKLLTALLHRFGWFAPEFSSKNFTFAIDELDGHIMDLEPQQAVFYRKFFLDTSSEEFFSQLHSFGHEQYNHAANIRCLEKKLASSFVHVVSESLATSYHPFVTEKFLYSVVTRGLFLAWAQPGWHQHLEHYYGFRPYADIFDYSFDSVQEPIQRLIALMSMLAKFSVLAPDDWRDLYEMEVDTLEYNYDWYFSGNYLRHLQQFFS